MSVRVPPGRARRAPPPSRSWAEGGGRWRRAGPGCCCGRRCGRRGGADGGPEGEAPCGGYGCCQPAASLPLPGPVPAASSPPAHNALVRAEAGPRRQLRRIRDPPHALGSASLWLRSGRLCRVSTPAGRRGAAPRGPSQGGRGSGGVGGRAAAVLRSFRPRLNAVGAARVWETQGRGRGCFCWVKGACGSSPLVRFETLAFGPGPELLRSKRWARTAGRREELPRLQTRAVAELSGDCLGLGVPCPRRGFVLSPCSVWKVLALH